METKLEGRCDRQAVNRPGLDRLLRPLEVLTQDQQVLD